MYPLATKETHIDQKKSISRNLVFEQGLLQRLWILWRAAINTLKQPLLHMLQLPVKVIVTRHNVTLQGSATNQTQNVKLNNEGQT